MSFHTDYHTWVKMSDPNFCPVCQDEPMPDGMVDIASLPHSWLVAEPVECLRGACHLVARRHAIELFDLDDQELLGLMREVAHCARALQEVTGAVKINYEIHGNSVPHLHIHLYPRYVDDPFPGQPIDYRQKRSQYAGGEFQAFVQQMQERLT